jgi:thiosulfate/3-mercaptopyruvate sulfurtransferase
MSGYAHPEVLVSTRWVADHLDDPAVRFVEIETTTEAYDSGHVAGAVGWDLYEDLLRPEPDYRIVDRPALEALLSRSGISNDTTVVFYGDRACSPAMAFWLLSVYGHREVRFMNGGRKKWIAEDRPITTASPAVAATTCTLGDPDWSSRALRDSVRQSIDEPGSVIVDVRNAKEYRGEMFWPSWPPEEGERAGHIPGAVHIPYEMALNEDGTFKSFEELRELYASKGVTAEKAVITYCTVGARSCNTWFVLEHLLGYPNVREYEASWYEWGRLPNTPVER